MRELTLYKPVLDLLSKNTGKKIEFYMPTSYSSVVEALLGKWVDVAVLGPESYLIAKSKGAIIDVFATYYKKKDGVQEAGPGFKSILITQEGLEVHDVDSVKGSVMLLVDPASTSGSLIPESIFGGKVVKMPLKQYFSKVAFSGGHDLSTLAVFDGKADAAFVATHRFMNTLTASKGKMKADDFNILWTSPLIPQDPFVYRATLCPELKKQIQQTVPDARRNARGQEVPRERRLGEVRRDEGLRLRRHPRSRRRQVARRPITDPRSRGDAVQAVLEVKNLRAGYADARDPEGRQLLRSAPTTSSPSSARAAPASRR